MHSKLVELAKKYLETTQNIRRIEGETATSSLTARTVNDLRHLLIHITTAVTMEAEGEPQDKIEAQYNEALMHLRNHAPNAFEIIAGKALNEAKRSIESAGHLSKVSKAQNLHDEAIEHYTKARGARTADPEQALVHFENAINLAIEASRSVEKASFLDRFGVWTAIILILLAALNIALRVWG